MNNPTKRIVQLLNASKLEVLTREIAHRLVEKIAQEFPNNPHMVEYRPHQKRQSLWVPTKEVHYLSAEITDDGIFLYFKDGELEPLVFAREPKTALLRATSDSPVEGFYATQQSPRFDITYHRAWLLKSPAKEIKNTDSKSAYCKNLSSLSEFALAGV
jgi:hypothetical protein